MDKKDILYSDAKDVVVCKPPECRIIQMGVNYFLSLPYIVYIVRRQSNYSYICVAFSQQPVTTIDDPLFGLPLPNIHYNGFVCGISAQVGKEPVHTAEKMIDVFWNSQWRCCRGYHWMDLYGSNLIFHNNLRELLGKKAQNKVELDPYGSAGDAEMYRNWQELTKSDPGFIMKMPLLAHADSYKTAGKIIQQGLY